MAGFLDTVPHALAGARFMQEVMALALLGGLDAEQSQELIAGGSQRSGRQGYSWVDWTLVQVWNGATDPISTATSAIVLASSPIGVVSTSKAVESAGHCRRGRRAQECKRGRGAHRHHDLQDAVCGPGGLRTRLSAHRLHVAPVFPIAV